VSYFRGFCPLMGLPRPSWSAVGRFLGYLWHQNVKKKRIVLNALQNDTFFYSTLCHPGPEEHHFGLHLATSEVAKSPPGARCFAQLDPDHHFGPHLAASAVTDHPRAPTLGPRAPFGSFSPGFLRRISDFHVGGGRDNFLAAPALADGSSPSVEDM
jgi:hypothetical protein